MSLPNASSYGQVCILGFQGLNYNMTVGYAKIEDTAGVVTPLDWTNYTTFPTQINRFRYFGPTTENTQGCNTTQFMFYNSLGQDAGVAYLTPGQLGNCWYHSGDTYCYCNKYWVTGWVGRFLIDCYLGSNVSISTNAVTPVPKLFLPLLLYLYYVPLCLYSCCLNLCRIALCVVSCCLDLCCTCLCSLGYAVIDALTWARL